MKEKPMSLADRVVQIRAMIEAEPGIQPSEIAERTGIGRGHVSKIVPELGEDVVRKKADKGYGLHLSNEARRRKMLRDLWR